MDYEDALAFPKKDGCTTFDFYTGGLDYPCKVSEDQTREFVGWFKLIVAGCNSTSSQYPRKKPWCSKNQAGTALIKIEGAEYFENMLTGEFWTSCDICSGDPDLANTRFKAIGSEAALPEETIINITVNVDKANGKFVPKESGC
jgi:hypothetical protein